MKKYPKFLINLLCCFVLKKKNRHHIREKYMKKEDRKKDELLLNSCPNIYQNVSFEMASGDFSTSGFYEAEPMGTWMKEKAVINLKFLSDKDINLSLSMITYYGKLEKQLKIYANDFLVYENSGAVEQVAFTIPKDVRKSDGTVVLSFISSGLETPEGDRRSLAYALTSLSADCSFIVWPSSIELNGQTSFSQFGEDLIIVMLFHYLFGKNVSNIKYVDIGANDPVWGNNTYLLYKCGGQGVLIEPNPFFISLYQKIRPQDKVIHAGINFGSDQKSADYYDFGEVMHGWNTFSVERKDEVIKTYPLVKVHHIPLVDINDVLAEMDGVDFISLDVEGLDFEILKTLNFNEEKFRPKMFCIEANKHNIDYGYESELVKFMKEKDYIVVADNFINLIFADIRQIRHIWPENLSYGNTVLKTLESSK